MFFQNTVRGWYAQTPRPKYTLFTVRVEVLRSHQAPHSDTCIIVAHGYSFVQAVSNATLATLTRKNAPT